jgi:hypothetical protein
LFPHIDRLAEGYKKKRLIAVGLLYGLAG